MTSSPRRRRGYSRRQLVGVVCGIALAGLLAGCTQASPTGVQQGAHTGRGAGYSPAAAQGGAGPDAHAGHLPAAEPIQQQATLAVGAQAAGDAALQLQALLGQHSIVACEMMRSRIRGDEDFAQSANAALGKNTEAIAGLVQSVLGQEAAGQFRNLWTGHITALFNYARGLANNDANVRNESQATLTAFESSLADFYSQGSQGRLPRDAANAAVQAHVHHMLHQADTYAARNYAESNKTFREAYAHTFGLGKGLAGALLGPEAAQELETPTWRLRSELTRLLGEHVVLAVAATRAGVTNSPDFSAAAELVNGNTADLAAAMDTLFGGPAASNFNSLWADHLDQVMAYTSGVVGQDAQRRDQARAGLGVFDTRLAEFLGSATGNRLAAPELAKALARHDQLLLEQVDAYAAKDYQRAHDVAASTYEHMREMATQMASAFGETVAARLPSGGPETGGGGTAPLVENR